MDIDYTHIKLNIKLYWVTDPWYLLNLILPFSIKQSITLFSIHGGF